jgi:hypothetical protein
MNTSQVTTLRRALTTVVVVGVLLFPASSALAEGAVTFTETWHNVTESFPDVNPCTGDPSTVTITYNGVGHVTLLPNGTSHFTITQTGDVVFVPDDPSLPTYTGHFTIWGGFNSNNKNAAGTFTFTVHLTGSDGSTLKFHITEHFNVSASGVVNTFSKPRCG